MFKRQSIQNTVMFLPTNQINQGSSQTLQGHGNTKSANNEFANEDETASWQKKYI
jgi:hypothetical protein